MKLDGGFKAAGQISAEVMTTGFYTDLRRFMGSQVERKKKKVQRKAKVPQCQLSEDIVRYHWGAKTAKWADNATERKII